MNPPWNILAIGLNPSYQKSLQFDHFQVGEVNRASSLTISTGGKGQHFAKAANSLVSGCSIVAHFLGGSTGQFLEDDLNSCHIRQIIVRIPQPTRICNTLLCNKTKEMTEVIEPSATITPRYSKEILRRIDHTYSQMEKMAGKIAKMLPEIQAIAICGTSPSGVPPSFLAQVANSKPNGALLLLDGYKNIQEILDSKSVDILKINALEIKSLMGHGDVIASARECQALYNIRLIAITDGPKRAFLFDENLKEHFEFSIPPLENVINPIGAGDTCGAVFLVGILRNISPLESFRRALGAASASCLHIEGAKFDLADMESISNDIRVDTLPG